MVRRDYFEEQIGFMKWKVFFSDDDSITKHTASDNIYIDQRGAMMAAAALRYAFNAGASFATKYPDMESEYWTDKT